MLPRGHVVLTLLLSGLCLVQVCISAALSPHSTLYPGSMCRNPENLDNNSLLSVWALRPAPPLNKSCESSNQHQHPTVVSNDTLTNQDQVVFVENSLRETRTRNVRRQTGEKKTSLDLRPTPQPTGNSTHATTVHITSNNDFALLLPGTAGELISDAESDGISYCTGNTSEASCADRPSFPAGFISAAVVHESDDGSWIQVTGCLDTSKFHLDPSDAGGQFDVRFPNGAQCAFGGYGASFIELVEPALSRFCLRCCSASNDQTHCNSHQDRLGCTTAVPGQYDFPNLGISCS